MNVRTILTLFFSSFILVGCNQTPDSPSSSDEASPIVKELPEDFLVFYEEFHQDTVFQLNRIAFPLSGKPASRQFNIELKDFKWTRDGWKIHKRIADDDDTFDRKYTMFTDNLITEIIYAPQYGYHMERRFGKLSDGWNLIYYADMQEPKQQ